MTGTNGKTTTTWLIAQALARLRRPVARTSTLGSYLDDEPQALPKTYQGFLALMRRALDAGGAYAVIELTSEALALGFGRAWPSRVGVFTNLSEDHLQFHKSFEHYLASKAQLFVGLPPGGAAVLNADDPCAALLADVTPAGVRVLRYSLAGADVELRARAVELDWSGTRVDYEERGLVPDAPPVRGRLESSRRSAAPSPRTRSRPTPRRASSSGPGRRRARGHRERRVAAGALRGPVYTARYRRRLRAHARRADAHGRDGARALPRAPDGRVRRGGQPRSREAGGHGPRGAPRRSRDPDERQPARRGPGGDRRGRARRSRGTSRRRARARPRRGDRRGAARRGRGRRDPDRRQGPRARPGDRRRAATVLGPGRRAPAAGDLSPARRRRSSGPPRDQTRRG
ncbi:MAG: hypothetical protein H6713_34795 [Myxococcales bacterium]|nr:hypothetical protein [Myxococcales bacterium]